MDHPREIADGFTDEPMGKNRRPMFAFQTQTAALQFEPNWKVWRFHRAPLPYTYTVGT
jgi:hypothetical protein